ncbi:predicted protein [Sclerotinia sclerotiorum 1980 UF-70]|uniref:Uncharacterized protein n=1 Tax=Sclerotinia sclerotiorum (strain ATCC 18683 / 1980 / Ss-1) TaxID=665079 RepID=A7F2C4_SCLS1|nr:predicted protein [Sclerotinia sclerotiorum 1980 UF-70]EDN95866.1 predicted protein [Sclerotinia sclerotiorum 1980 UF-70]
MFELGFVTIPITHILVMLSRFRSSDYFWAPVTYVIFVIVILISYFHMHHEKKLEGVEETYTIAWEEKTRNIAKIIQNRIYVKDQKTKFRASHLAQIHHLQSIPGNQHPKSMGNMRHEMTHNLRSYINGIPLGCTPLLPPSLFSPRIDGLFGISL